MDILEQLKREGIDVNNLPPGLTPTVFEDIQKTILAEANYFKIDPDDPAYEDLKDFKGVTADEFYRLGIIGINMIYEAINKGQDSKTVTKDDNS